MRPIILHGHTRPLTQIKYNKEGDLLFSCARDKSANVFYSHNGELLGSFDGHNGALFSLDPDSHTSRLLTASADNTAKLWDIQYGKCLQTWSFETGVRSVEFALGDREFLALTDSRMGKPGLLNIFSASNGSETPIQSVVVPDSRASVARWASCNRIIFTGHEDGTICSWHPTSGKKLKSVKHHTGSITDIQLSSDGTYFISSSKDQSAKIIDAETLEVVKTYVSDRPLNSAAISPIFEQVVLGGGQEARDVTTTSARAGRFEACFYHRVYAQEIGRVKGHFGPINTIAYHPDGTGFSSGGEEGYVRIHHFDPNYFEFDYEMDI